MRIFWQKKLNRSLPKSRLSAKALATVVVSLCMLSNHSYAAQKMLSAPLLA